MPVRGSIGKRSISDSVLRLDIAKVVLLIGVTVLGHIGDARNRRDCRPAFAAQSFGLAEDGGRVQSAAHGDRDGYASDSGAATASFRWLPNASTYSPNERYRSRRPVSKSQ